MKIWIDWETHDVIWNENMRRDTIKDIAAEIMGINPLEAIDNQGWSAEKIVQEIIETNGEFNRLLETYDTIMDTIDDEAVDQFNDNYEEFEFGDE